MIKLNQKILKYCEKIINKLNINGACDFDIILNNKQEPQLLDGSCRLSGSVSASINSGVNIPAQLIRVLKSKDIKKYKLKNGQKLFPTSKFVKI